MTITPDVELTDGKRASHIIQNAKPDTQYYFSVQVYVPADQPVQEGRIGYHLRAGRHFLSREDWGHCMRFIHKHHNETP